jgi:2'-5' RNA ligase
MGEAEFGHRMRTFVAVEVAEAGASGSTRSTAPTHLTLAFLGEIPRERVAGIVERLRPIGPQVPPFDLELSGVGAFPSPQAPRVVWIGVQQGRAEVVALAHRVHEALRDEWTGSVPEEFVPHVTYFRVRSFEDRRAAYELLQGRRPAPPPRRAHVREFVLKESVLGHGGATHRTLATFPLTGGQGPPPTPPADGRTSSPSGLP